MRNTVLICLSALLYITILSTVSADLVYRNPRVFNVTCSFELNADPAKSERLYNRSIDRDNDLKLWLPIPREWDTQKAVGIISVQPPPHARYEDPEHGNPILFWDFGKEPEKALYKVELKLRLEVYEVHPEVDPKQVGTYDRTSDEYNLYTRSSHSICITPKVRELALEAVGDEKNPYLQAKRIAGFVMRKVRYKILDQVRGRGIKVLLENPVKDEGTGEEYYEGHCVQRSALIVACCRAMGIPARSVNGFVGWKPWVKEEDLQPLVERLRFALPEPGSVPEARRRLGNMEYSGHMNPHMWTEFYIPNYGWIPIDGSKIRPLRNKRVIFAKGRDVKIGPHCPQADSVGYGTQNILINDGRVDMLGWSGIWNMARLENPKVKLLITLDPFPADGFTEYSEQLYPEDDYERKLNSWRSKSLESIDWITRGSQNREAYWHQYMSLGRVPILHGAFVCHMLRKIVGDDKFFQIFREYEDLRLDSGAAVSTDRFQEIAENAYGEPLDWFFDQWLNTKSLPQLKLSEVTVNKDGEEWQIRGHFTQTGKVFFRMPVELALDVENGKELHRIWQESRDTEFELRSSSKPIELKVDADNDILKIQKMPSRLVWFWKAYDKMIIIYGTIAEADANKAAAERLADEYLGLSHEIIKADTTVTEEDLKTDCIFLFGRPATNKIAQQFRDVFPIKFDESKFTFQEAIYDQPTQGVAQVVDHPLNPNGLLILYAGLSGEATLHVCDSYLYDAKASYVIFDGEKTLVSGDWEEAESDLVWKFDIDRE